MNKILKSALVATIIFSKMGFSGTSTICAPGPFLPLDPHRGQSPSVEYLSSQIYFPLFKNPTHKVAMAKSWKPAKGNKWIITLDSSTAFLPTPHYPKSKRLNSSDVVYSLQRQLMKNAQTRAESMTFAPAKLRGLSEKLSEVKGISPTEVELTFTSNISEKSLMELLAPPIGYVVPANFLDPKSGLGADRIYPSPVGKITEVKNFRIKLEISKLNDLSFKAFDVLNFSSRWVKEQKCDVIVQPPGTYLKELKDGKGAVNVTVMSSSRLFFRMNPKMINESKIPLLQNIFNPEKYNSLKNVKPFNGFFTNHKMNTKALPKVPLKRNIKEVFYCSLFDYPEIVIEELLSEIKTRIKDSLGLKINFVALTCDYVSVMDLKENGFGVLSVFDYQSEKELLQAFSCEAGNYQPFGTCLMERNLKPDLVDNQVQKEGVVYPLAGWRNIVLKLK
jgi:hypothetical protein